MLTEDDVTPDGESVPTLQQLVQARVDERGWSDGQLAARSGFKLSRNRWQQMRTGVRMTAFPKPPSILLIAEVLECDVTTVLLAIAQTLRMPVRRRGPDLAYLLPAGVDRLPAPMTSAILGVIRAAVALTLAGEETDEGGADKPSEGSHGGGTNLTLEWPEHDVSSAGNAERLRADTNR